MGVRIAVRNGKAKPFIRRHVLRVTAVQGVTVELSLFTKVFPTRLAITADTAGPAEPGNTHSGAGLEAFRVFAYFYHLAHNLVTKDEWQFRIRHLSVRNLKVGPADSAGTDLHQDLAFPTFGAREACLVQSGFHGLKDHRFHHRFFADWIN